MLMLKKILAFTLFPLASFVQAEQFQVPVTDTHWLVTESPLECSLSQSINDFGEAKFIQRIRNNIVIVPFPYSPLTIKINCIFFTTDKVVEPKQDWTLVSLVQEEAEQ